MKTFASFLASTFLYTSAVFALNPEPPGELLLRLFPPDGAILLDRDATLRLEVELFVPYRWVDPKDPSRPNWHTQRTYEPIPFSIREPLGTVRREVSRLLFFTNSVN